MASKRKRNVLTLEKKLEIIGDMKKGKSVRLFLVFQSPQLEIFGRTGRRLNSMCLQVTAHHLPRKGTL